MERLTAISEITGLPMLKWLKESCGEDSCASECEDHNNGADCENCKIQEAITELYDYEDTGLTPEQITALQAERSTARIIEKAPHPYGAGTERYHCSACDARVQKGDRYCRQCGRNIDWSSEDGE